MKNKLLYPFYDVHFHAINLSHINISAYFHNINLLKEFKYIDKVEFIFNLLFNNIKKIFNKNAKNKVLNLLSMIENDIGTLFLLLEYFLKNDPDIIYNDKTVFGQFNKIILVPLIIDFYVKYDNKNNFYHFSPVKPVSEQVVDLFYGIEKYYQYELSIVDNDFKLEKFTSNKQNKLFEFYPFIGINPLNFKNKFELEKTLDLYFKKYSGNQHRINKKIMNIKKFKNKNNLSNFFAGIKVYPSSGFDPYPENDNKSLAILELFYNYCTKKQIPITTHCQEFGIDFVKNASTLCSPFKWEKVFKNFNVEKLKINLAHIGRQNSWFGFKTNWENKVLELVGNYKNIYTDFAFWSGTKYGFFKTKEYNKHLEQLLDKNAFLKDKLLFGSDFFLTLLKFNSYNEYLTKFYSYFKDKDYLMKICSINAERFLFK